MGDRRSPTTSATDEAEPEVLFTCGQHAREHLTIEMCLYLLNELTSKYATDARIANVVNSREIYIIHNLNPDGAEYDVATGSYRSWRKNRQPNSGSSASAPTSTATGASSGAAAAVRAVRSRRRPTAARRRSRRPRPSACATSSTAASSAASSRSRPGIDFHTYSELVLWPYGYTTTNVTGSITADVEATFRTLGQNMASTNGYTPEQASDLYIADGTIDDWLWGQHRSSATRSRCTRARRARASIRPTR